MLADYHAHTEFSDDSVYPLEQVVKDAIALGLKKICITDHVDYGVKVVWDSGEAICYRHGEPLVNVDYSRYVKEIERVRQLYEDWITVKMGMEFSVQTHTIPQVAGLRRLRQHTVPAAAPHVKGTLGLLPLRNL